MSLDGSAKHIRVGTSNALALGNTNSCFTSTQQHKRWHCGYSVRTSSGSDSVHVHTTKATSSSGILVGKKTERWLKLLTRRAPE
jgi:hypothetical protein